MYEKGMFPFDADKMAEMFKAPDMNKLFESMNMPGVDAQAMIELQRRNMDALIAANQAAAAGYQDFFRKQVAIFEETMATAQAQIASMRENAGPEGASKQAELYKAAFEKALANMTELAEAAKKANEEAFAIVSARVQESIAELQAMAPRDGRK